MSVRPSLADRAERCGHVLELAARYRETSPAAERGLAVDREVTRELLTGTAATDPDARACLDWIRAESGGGRMWVQDRVELYDPESWTLLAEGTPDVQYELRDGDSTDLVTCDLKKREQYVGGLLRSPDDGLQCHAYSVARAMAIGARRYRNVYLLFGDGEVKAVSSRWYGRDEWHNVIARYRALATKDRTPAPGDHCTTCYSRWYCDAFRARTALALTLIGETVPSRMTDEQATELLRRAEAVEAAAQLARQLVRSHVHAGGSVVSDGKRYVPVLMPGRRTADVAALERDGLADRYVRQGAPYEQWRWMRTGDRT